MEHKSAWIGCILVTLIPIAASLIMLYSDVNALKLIKADTQEVSELRLEFTEQMIRNTSAIENLNETLKTIRRSYE